MLFIKRCTVSVQINVLNILVTYTLKMRNLTRLLVGDFFEVIHICKDLNLFQKFLKTLFIKKLFIEGEIVVINCILH